LNKRKLIITSITVLIIFTTITPSIYKLTKAESEVEVSTVGKYLVYGGYSALSLHVMTGSTTIVDDGNGNKYVDLEGGSILGINIGSVTYLTDIGEYRSIYKIRILVHVFDYTYQRTLSTSYILGGSAPVFERQNNKEYGTYYSVLMDAFELVADCVCPGSGLVFTFLSYLYDPGGMTLGIDGSSKVASWKSGTWDTHTSQECQWDGYIRGLSSSNSRIYKIGVDVEVTQYYNFRYWTQIISNCIYVNGIPASDGSGGGGGSGPIDTID